ncbi:hypothetical protein [Gordonia sp. ABSL49_1]|uniref:hypothetical protein n=1 Tax=Gordonia sp. ABSL49_1 TaxID=2920941 RepID=UPI001F0F734A|nr:hypothetical protein [Gordonia sp. ABSL49_1]MCH5644159.1 hypothetical protein [Gordonia sp. ABSL49_1]
MGDWKTEQIGAIGSAMSVRIREHDGDEGEVWPVVCLLRQRNADDGECRVVLGVLHAESGSVVPFVERCSDGLAMTLATDADRCCSVT